MSPADDDLEVQTQVDSDAATVAPHPLSSIGDQLDSWLPEWAQTANAVVNISLKAGIILVVALIAFGIVRGLIIPALHKIILKTKMAWDDVIIEAKFLERFSLIVPAAVIYFGALAFFGPWFLLTKALTNVAAASMILIGAQAMSAMLTAINTIYERAENRSKERPIKGYLQIAKIILFVVTTIVAIAMLLDKSPIVFLTGLGAMTAVLLLVFKDTVLSLVASITLTSNDMIHVGDWIEMPSQNTDGDVIDISLHTVKVQNWDKTISTIPTYRLISESFKNWRGMSESGGRRIKRSLSIDMSSIRFLNEADIERYASFALLKDYIAEKVNDLKTFNAEHCTDPSIVVNARRLTNIGTFRAYVIKYLRSLNTIHQSGMTFLVRQLPPTSQGLPIEIYIFTTTVNWIEYEGIQGDIFDHLLAIAPEFGLRAFQAPTGDDFQKLVSS